MQWPATLSHPIKSSSAIRTGDSRLDATRARPNRSGQQKPARCRAARGRQGSRRRRCARSGASPARAGPGHTGAKHAAKISHDAGPEQTRVQLFGARPGRWVLSDPPRHVLPHRWRPGAACRRLPHPTNHVRTRDRGHSHELDRKTGGRTRTLSREPVIRATRRMRSEASSG